MPFIFSFKGLNTRSVGVLKEVLAVNGKWHRLSSPLMREDFKAPIREVGVLPAAFTTDTSLVFICLTLKGTKRKQLALALPLKESSKEIVFTGDIVLNKKFT